MTRAKQINPKLSEEAIRVCLLSGTEAPFTGMYDDFYETGEYACVNCGTHLFTSDTKYKSGSGWPSFFQPINDVAVAEHDDTSLGVRRTEVVCANCEAHLGHVFNDGPKPSGLRYCINSASLRFIRAAKT